MHITLPWGFDMGAFGGFLFDDTGSERVQRWWYIAWNHAQFGMYLVLIKCITRRLHCKYWFQLVKTGRHGSGSKRRVENEGIPWR